MDSLKLKFFLYHLLTSLIIVISLSVICQFYWFPAPFLIIDGTWIALITLAVVDIIIGPLLTLFLVTSKKSPRELLLDMTIIVIIQLSALSYGFIKIEQERIWAIIHIDGVFVLVPQKEVSKEYLTAELVLPQYKDIYYGMVLNSEISLHSKIGSKPLMYSPERFHSIKSRNMLSKAISHEQLPDRIKVIYNKQHIFKALIGKKKDAIIVLNTGMNIIDIVLLHNAEVTLPLF
jgi:hypothetical protein